jgi:hypothetical protein
VVGSGLAELPHHRGQRGEPASPVAGGAVAELAGQQPDEQRVGDRVGLDAVEQVIPEQLRRGRDRLSGGVVDEQLGVQQPRGIFEPLDRHRASYRQAGSLASASGR